MKETNEIPKVFLYSDGGAEPNPGKGGYGLILSCLGYKQEFYQGFEMTTNNRMELMGVIAGLEKLKRASEVQVYTDSKYVVDGIEKGWAKRWQANNWLRKGQKKAINFDLWQRLLDLLSKHKVKFNWVKGHAGHVENERCDVLALMGIKQEILIKDTGYFGEDEKVPTQGSLMTVTTKIQAKRSKVERIEDPCRDCNIPVEKRVPKRRKIKENQPYYYEYYLYCKNCKKMYMVEDGKREIKA